MLNHMLIAASHTESARRMSALFSLPGQHAVIPERLEDLLIEVAKPETKWIMIDSDLSLEWLEQIRVVMASRISPIQVLQFHSAVARGELDTYAPKELNFRAEKEAFERAFLKLALKIDRGRINRTALLAKIPKKTLLRKLVRYGISAKSFLH